MSDTFSIACVKCRKHLWIAQGWRDDPSSGHMYSTPPHIHAHYAFLREHQSHELVFDENCDGQIGDFQEVEWCGTTGTLVDAGVCNGAD